MHSIIRTILALFAVLCVCACGAKTSESSASEPTSTAVNDSDAPPAAATTTTTTTTTPEASPDTAAESKPGVGAASSSANTEGSCGGKKCADGQSCIEYYGVTGRPLYTCGIPCTKGAPNDGCPDAMQCRVIPDGPTECVGR